MDIVGLPDAAVKESAARVQTAIRNAGLPYPRERIIVNLAPVSVRKEGPAYDLPIALGIVMMGGSLNPDIVKDALIIGELSLDGIVRHARVVLPMVAAAREQGFKRIFVSETDAAEAVLIPDLEVYPVNTLSALYGHLAGFPQIQSFQSSQEAPDPLFVPTDFAEVKGQDHVKRALEVAAAGGHNCLMVMSSGAARDPRLACWHFISIISKVGKITCFVLLHCNFSREVAYDRNNLGYAV